DVSERGFTWNVQGRGSDGPRCRIGQHERPWLLCRPTLNVDSAVEIAVIQLRRIDLLTRIRCHLRQGGVAGICDRIREYRDIRIVSRARAVTSTTERGHGIVDRQGLEHPRYGRWRCELAGKLPATANHRLAPHQLLETVFRRHPGTAGLTPT